MGKWIVIFTVSIPDKQLNHSLSLPLLSLSLSLSPPPLSLSVLILPRLQVNFKIISKLIYLLMKENVSNELLTTLK